MACNHDDLGKRSVCRWLGVEKIYLMENVETPTESFVQQIGDFIAEGVVDYLHNGTVAYQARWYFECMEMNHQKHNWHVHPLMLL
jgi:hypothetical protein